MNNKELIKTLNSFPSHENLYSVIELCAFMVDKSKKCEINVGEYKLSADHFYQIYAGRMKNSNGVAARTPGLPESVESLKKTSGLVQMISVELDDQSIVIWISTESKIVGCIKFLTQDEALRIAEDR